MDKFSLKRVIWRDGDVITESHFLEQERWFENIISLSNQSYYRYGLFRNILLQDYYNKPMNISFHHIEGAQYRVDIEYFQGINQLGKIFKIDDKREFKLNVEFTKGDKEGKILVYLLPKRIDRKNDDEIERISDEIETGTRLYDDQYVLSTTNSNNEGIPIMRFVNRGNNLDIDETFVPFGLFINSSSSCIQAHQIFLEEYLRYKRHITDYVKTQSPDHNAIIWTTTTNILRILFKYEQSFNDSTIPTVVYIGFLSSFFYEVQSELFILTEALRGEINNYKTVEVIDVLKEALIKTTEQQYDLEFAFRNAMKKMEMLIKHLEYLPEGKDTEKELPIGETLQFDKIAGWNRLTVPLSENIKFKKGASIMTITLRSFTRSEPIHTNARVGLGIVPPAHLRDMINVIKPIKDERHSYRIECPKEAVDRSEADAISIYLPPPMGENVPDIRSNIKITIRS